MCDLTEDMREGIRKNSLGPIAYGSWSWTWSKGATYAAVAMDGDDMIGWAIVTEDVDSLPVIGLFVVQAYRRTGLSELIVSTLLNWLTPAILPPGSQIFASLGRWPKYTKVIRKAGHEAVLWE